MAAYCLVMIHVTCRLTAKIRDQLRNPTLGNRVRADFAFLTVTVPVASFRGQGGLRTPPRIVKCKSSALSVSSKGSLYISHNGR